MNERSPGSITSYLPHLGREESARDREALHRILNRLHCSARMARLPRGQSASDLVQGVFENVLSSRARPVFPNRRSFFGWLDKVKRNWIANEVRSQQALKRGGDFDQQVLDSSIESPPPDHLAIEIRDTIHELKPHYPEPMRILELRVFQGLTLEEAAKEMNLSRKEASRRYFRALAALREHWCDHDS